MMNLRKIGVVLAGLMMSMGIVSANPMNSQQEIEILASQSEVCEWIRWIS